MEEKGVRDRKREPEEYTFDYEELADAEVDSEQAGRRDDAVWETTCDTEDPYTVESEDFTEDEDYGEYPEGDDLDDFDEGDGIGFRFRPWMIPAFAGMMVLAVLICIPLWKLSQQKRRAQNRLLQRPRRPGSHRKRWQRRNRRLHKSPRRLLRSLRQQ